MTTTLDDFLKGLKQKQTVSDDGYILHMISAGSEAVSLWSL